MGQKNNREKRARHREFVKEYLANGNRQDKAYMKAYNVDDPIYASKAAYKLMNEVAYVQELMVTYREKLDNQYEINRGTIIRDLMELIGECKDDKDRQNLLKSLDMLNKMAGNYTEKKEVNVTGTGIVFNFVKPEEVEAPDDINLLTEERFDEEGNLITDN